MSAFHGDQLHRSTLRVYSNLVEDFNPSLQKLVSLGNSYIQAFRAFASTSDAYFGALSKIGEKALHTVSSRSLGQVLMQISESQRRFTVELDGVLQWFSVEVIRQMDSNTRQDRSFISDSRKFYEMEVHNKATALERQLWRGNNSGEYLQFLKRSNEEALKEEERRHRFLAEKHCGLVQSITHLMNKTGSSLQQKVDAWTKDVSATRELEASRRPSVSNSVGMREDMRRAREEQRGGREEQRGGREEQRGGREPALGNVPSRAPSPQESLYREPIRDGGVGRTMRARTSHQPAASNRTLLPFSKGEMITVLVPQPRKGWLYGQAESSTQQGWFPASFAEAVADPPPQAALPRPTLRSSSSSGSLADQPQSRRHSEAQAAPPPPPPPMETDMGPPRPRAESTSENNRSKSAGSQPELFPRGTNPFATVKLRPTTTDDRSAPRFNR
ncbi:brain-specific angiogenesis inhibitor 1-associated protein 2-like protein 2 isoform X2 [Takifugu flavidus]|uniref:brain-specific angiogenesis inhibitor 1-associated protein 2-like protein 2 isoform X2 n=1 Tax=Takifugu flavidus TaxID=433684 RepID=UPI002544A2DB|nr:brain-specific angiogenesis inhibitor 1-associated protein 2-like protein 2 isoform X2 [Takifugu flavidus]